MSKDIIDLLGSAKKISMSSDEKRHILESVFDAPHIPYVAPEAAPVRMPFISRLYSRRGIPTLAEFNPFVSMSRSHVFAPLGIVFVLLGTTSALAQIALPGDVLYPIKINVNEKLQALTAITPEAQATLEVAFANKRLEEARALVASNKLTASTSEQLATQFEVHTSNLEGRLGELKKQGYAKEATDIRSSFVASVQTQHDVLDTLAASTSLRNTLTRIDRKEEASQENLAVSVHNAALLQSTSTLLSATATATTSQTEKDAEGPFLRVSKMWHSFIGTTTGTSTKEKDNKKGKHEKDKDREIQTTASSTIFIDPSTSKATAHSSTDVILSTSTPSSTENATTTKVEPAVETVPNPLEFDDDNASSFPFIKH